MREREREGRTSIARRLSTPFHLPPRPSPSSSLPQLLAGLGGGEEVVAVERGGADHAHSISTPGVAGARRRER